MFKKISKSSIDEEIKKTKIEIIYVLSVFSVCCAMIYFRESIISVFIGLVALLLIFGFNKLNKKYHFFVLVLLVSVFVPNNNVDALNGISHLTEKILFTDAPSYKLCGGSMVGAPGSDCSEYMVNNTKFYLINRDNFIKNLQEYDINLIILPNGKLVLNVDKLTDFSEEVILNSNSYTSYNLLFDFRTNVTSNFLNNDYYYSADGKINDYLVFYNLEYEFNDITDYDVYYTYDSYNYRSYAVKTLHKENDWKIASFNFDNIDEIHTFRDLHDVNGELLKKADIVFSRNTSDEITPKGDLDYDYIHTKMNQLMIEQYGYDYSDFNYHVIYEDESSVYRYNVVYYLYNTDFVFTNDGSGSVAKSAGTIYNTKVYMLSFNNMDELEKDIPVYFGEVNLKSSKKINLLWADNIIYLYKFKYLLNNYYADTNTILHEGTDTYNPFSGSIEIDPKYYAILIPKKNYNFSSKIAMTTAYYYGWYSFIDDNYNLIPNSDSGAIISLLEGTSGSSFILDNGNTVSSHLLIENIEVFKSYYENNYSFIIHNRNENETLKFYYEEEDFEVLNFSDSISSLTSSTNGITYINKSTEIKEEVDSNYGTVDIGSSADNYGISGLIGDLTNFSTDLLQTFSTIGDLINLFFATMPDFVVNGFKIIFGFGIIYIIVKIIRG